VIPEGTVCSAQLTPPFPTNRSNAPATIAPVYGARSDPCLIAKNGVEENPDDNVAQPRQDQGGKRFDPDADREICGAPDDVDGGKGNENQRCHAGRSLRRGRGSLHSTLSIEFGSGHNFYFSPVSFFYEYRRRGLVSSTILVESFLRESTECSGWVPVPLLSVSG
jgi:hypothetical protein